MGALGIERIVTNIVDREYDRRELEYIVHVYIRCLILQRWRSGLSIICLVLYLLDTHPCCINRYSVRRISSDEG